MRVLDSAGHRLQGQLVNFRVTSGGGAMFAGSGISDDSGVVRDRWTLGTHPDSQRAEARAVDSKTGAGIVFGTFSATAIAGDPTILVRWMVPDTMTARAGASPVDSLGVRVGDTYGNGLKGMTVLWLITDGGGSVSPSATTTDSNGVARAKWTFGVPGSQAVQATVRGTTLLARFVGNGK